MLVGFRKHHQHALSKSLKEQAAKMLPLPWKYQGKNNFNPILHELSKKEKCPSLGPPRSNFCKTYKKLVEQDVKLTQLMSAFTSKND